MPHQDLNDETRALKIRSEQELSTRSSLVSRGLDEIARGFATHEESLAERAWALHQEGKFDEAISLCTDGLQADPNDDVLLQIKAVSLGLQDKYAEGLPLLQRALGIDQGNQHSWALAAIFYNHLGKSEEELGCWQRAVAIDPEYKGARKGIGDCLYALGFTRRALEAFNLELELNPCDEYCLSRRAELIGLLLGEERGEWTANAILTLEGWYSDKFDGEQLAPYTETRHLSLVSKISNISDHNIFIGKELSMYRRSKGSREMKQFAEALILEDRTFKCPLRVAPHSEVDPIWVELTWTCSLERSDPDCIEQLFDVNWETIARDDQFGTVIKLWGEEC